MNSMEVLKRADAMGVLQLEVERLRAKQGYAKKEVGQLQERIDAIETAMFDMNALLKAYQIISDLDHFL